MSEIQHDNHGQPEIGTRADAVIEVDGLKFRDLNGNGTLEPYEDWRLSPAERAADLVSRMTLEEKAGMMIIGSHYPGYSAFLPEPDENALLNPRDVWRENNPITGQPYPRPVLVTSATDKALNERFQHFFIVRDNPPARDLAHWTNAVQEAAEKTRLGVPAVFASNPRNHVALVAQFGVNESAGVFSEWPGELGLAALRDPELVEEFGRRIAREWRAAGIHKIYGYMADLPTEPRWSRFSGTFGEDVDMVSRYVEAVVRGMQGESLGAGSVATTVKHFPGGGVRTDGHDPHFSWGQSNEYPTDGALEKYHLPPFEAAVRAGVSSIMPYYARPVNTSARQLPEELQGADGQFEEVAFAYNAPVIKGLLRGRLGFDGYVNSDSGVIDAMPWGVEDLSEPERFAAAVRAGTDIFSDMADPTQLIAAVKEGHLDESALDASVTRLAAEMVELGLFENPYVDEDVAGREVGGTEVAELGARTQRRSVTLLRSDKFLLPLDLESSPMVYVKVTGRVDPGKVEQRLAKAVGEVWPHARVTDKVEDADLAIVWARPEIRLFEDDQEGFELSLDPRAAGVDVEQIQQIERVLPTVLAVEMSNPWLLREIEPGARALVATFGVTPENLLRSLAGEDGGPAGVLPMVLPASEKAVQDAPRDVPGCELDNGYVYHDRDGVAYTLGYGRRL